MPTLSWRYRVVLADRLGPRTYMSPDVRLNPGWGSEPFNAPIKEVELFLPIGRKIVMRGMAAYNFFVEAVWSLSGAGSRMVACWLCGRVVDSDQVHVWRIGNGRVVQTLEPLGREWKGAPTRGWKLGLPGNPVSQIMEL